MSFYNRIIETRVKASQYKRRVYLYYAIVTQLRSSRRRVTLR